jgi:hypothetical protein
MRRYPRESCILGFMVPSKYIVLIDAVIAVAMCMLTALPIMWAINRLVE